MRKVILSITCETVPFGLDLELPADVAVQELVAALLQVFQEHTGTPLPGGAWAVAAAPGRPLATGETLARAGIWDGGWLHIQRIQA